LLNQVQETNNQRQKANRAITIASGFIAAVVVMGTLARFRMEGFHPVFPIMWLGSFFAFLPLVFFRRTSGRAKSVYLWASWTLMAFGAFLMFGIGSAGIVFFLVAATFAALNLEFKTVLFLIILKSAALFFIVYYFSVRDGLPIPPQGIIFFQQPHIWIIHTLIITIAAVAIVYVTTAWTNLYANLAARTEENFYFGIGLLSLAHDTETGSHLERVARYSKLISEKYMQLLSDTRLTFSSDELAVASKLHDLGKISIAADILQKNGKLTKDEFEIIKTHTNIGAELIDQMLQKTDDASTSKLLLAKEVELNHHENWDGTGYPNGLKGHEIPLSARLVAVCDVYDALRSERPYKRAFAHNEALRIMDHERSKFDPQIFNLFLENAENLSEIFEDS